MMETKTIEPLWLKDIRTQALSTFSSLDYPYFKYGLSIVFDYSDLDVRQIELNKDATKINLENVQEVIICPLDEALTKYPKIVKNHLFQVFDSEKNKFTALHAASCADILLVYVPEGFASDDPIILNRNATKKTALHHTLVVAEKNSRVSIVEDVTSNSTYFMSSGTEIFGKENARVNWYTLHNYSQETFHFDYKKSHTSKGAMVNWFDFYLGGKAVHSDVELNLTGTESKGTVKGLFFGDNNQRFDLRAAAVHSAPHTVSDIVARGVLNDQSQNIYRGLVKIEHRAPTSNGYQNEDVLLLSPHAQANSIPQLEIDNDDVKCSHSATTTHLDDSKLFYLVSRGLSKKSAIKLMVQGFLQPFIDHVPIKSVVEKLQKHIEERIHVNV